MKHSSLLIATLALLIAACRPTPGDIRQVSEQPPLFPDYADVTIPVEIAPMNFCIDDPAVSVLNCEVTGQRGGTIHSIHHWFGPHDVAQFDIDEWHNLLRQNQGSTLTFNVIALREKEWIKYQPFTMTVSPHPLQEYGIVYRRIAPGFETFSDIGMYQRCLENFDEETIFDYTDVDGQCMNCHYANRTNPDQYIVHVRGKHGGTYVERDSTSVLLDTKTDQTCGSCTYGYWHPAGRYCAFSLNKAYQNFYTGPRKIIEPWDQVSDIVVLDTETSQLLRTTLLEGPDFQTTPAFSPDGLTIYYSSAPYKNLPAEYEQVKYSLCTIAFDPATATFGQRVDTLISGPGTGKSYSLPRPSYDGQYLMYCVTDQGTTPVLHMESDLWLMNLHTGETRPIDEVNSPETDAYHNWSSNSHWFLFGSKRQDHLYSLPYLSSINPDGHATKPFLLPQENPREYYLENLHSFNAPDFTARRIDLNRHDFSKRILNGQRTQVTAKEPQTTEPDKK